MKRNAPPDEPPEDPQPAPAETRKIDHPFLRELRGVAEYTGFGYDYFDNPGSLTGYGGYNDDNNGADGARNFVTEAAGIANITGVKTVLDVGCAKGYLVSALRRQGVEACGIDVSDYVVTTASPEVRPHLRCLRIQDVPTTESYDLVHLDGILEYLTRSEIRTALHRLHQVARIGILAHSATSAQISAWYDKGDLTAVDPLRKQEISREEWDELITSAGFVRDGVLFRKVPRVNGVKNGHRLLG